MLPFCDSFVLIFVIGTATAVAATDLHTGDFNFLIAYKNEIYLTTQNNDTVRYPIDTGAIIDIGYHPIKNLMFWIDSESNEIRYIQSFNVNITKSQMIIKQKRFWAPKALAVDYVNNKIYIVDESSGEVYIFDLDGIHHSIILDIVLTHPTDIKLDPHEGYIFVLDGLNVVRARMDGSSPVTILTNSVRPSHGMDIDVIAKKIYWSKKDANQIMSADYSGNNVVIVDESNSSYPSWSKFVMFNDSVVWAKQFVNCAKNCGESRRKSVNTVPTIKNLRSNFNATKLNPCEANNGGCEHMCVSMSKGANTGSDSYRCICDVGYDLAENLKSCLRVNKFLLYTQRSSLKSLIYENRENKFSTPFIPISIKRNNIVFGNFDYDYKNNYIYYVLKDQASGYGSLYRARPIESSEPELFYKDTFEYYESIALDWLTGNLYHTNSIEGTINVVNLQKESLKLTIIRKLLWPTDVAVHPGKGYIYFLQSNQISRETMFNRARTDGSNLTVFNNIVLKNKCSFVIDHNENRIYWFGFKEKLIYHSDLDMSDVKTIRIAINPYAIVIYDTWIYINSVTDGGMWRYDKKTGEKTKLMIDSLNGLKKVKMFDPEMRSVNSSHPCATNDGGCRHFCFAFVQIASNSWTKVCADSNV